MHPSNYLVSHLVSAGRLLGVSANSKPSSWQAGKRKQTKKTPNTTRVRKGKQALLQHSSHWLCQTPETTFEKTVFLQDRYSSAGATYRRANKKGHCHPKNLWGQYFWRVTGYLPMKNMSTEKCLPRNTLPPPKPETSFSASQIRGHPTHTAWCNTRCWPTSGFEASYTKHTFLSYIHFSIFILFLAWSSNTVLQVVFFSATDTVDLKTD